MNRKASSRKDELAVLNKCRHRCALCFYLDFKTDVERGQIAHIDNDASNSVEKNLVYLCLLHHDAYHLKSPLTKSITEDEVRLAKQNLEEWIEEHHSTMTSSSSSEDVDLVSPLEFVSPEVYRLRMPIYQATNHFASFIIREVKVPYEELFRFAGDTHNALFLFGEEIEDYCHLLYTKAIELRTLQTKMERPERFDNESWAEIVENETGIILWFSDQLREMKRKLYPYLKLGSQQKDGQVSSEDAPSASSEEPGGFRDISL